MNVKNSSKGREDISRHLIFFAFALHPPHAGKDRKCPQKALAREKSDN